MKPKENKGPYTFEVGSFYRCRAPRRNDVKVLILGTPPSKKIVYFANGDKTQKAKLLFRHDGSEYFVIAFRGYFLICEASEKISINTKNIKILCVKQIKRP